MNWIDELLRAYPQLSVARDQLEELQGRYSELETANARLKEEVRRLQAALASGQGAAGPPRQPAAAAQPASPAAAAPAPRVAPAAAAPAAGPVAAGPPAPQAAGVAGAGPAQGGAAAGSPASVFRAANGKIRFKSTIGQRGAAVAGKAYVESEGACWCRGADGAYLPTPHCPRCKLPMAPFPPDAEQAEFFKCSQCNIMAPFKAEKIPEILAGLPR